MDSSLTFMKSDSSSDDIDHHHHHQVYDDESDTTNTTKTTTTNTKRSYECTYCKRGFTNAQALGGHMNIHRKDRAKANNNKNKSSSSFSKSPLNEDYFDHVEPYHMHFPSMVASPDNIYNPQPMVFYGNDFATSRSNEDGVVCADSSLRVDSTYLEDQNKNHGVDLELRLGPDPCIYRPQ